MNRLDDAPLDGAAPRDNDENFLRIGRKLQAVLAGRSGDTQSADHHPEASPWNLLRRTVAERLDKKAYRAASALTMMEVAMAAASLNVVDLGDVDSKEVTRDELQDREQEEWSADLVQLAEEIYTIKCVMILDILVNY